MPRLFSLALVLISLPAAAQDRPIPPKEAPKAMTVPKNFNVTLFAGEPDVVQPIGMTFDDRGRLWVVECLSYPKWSSKPEGSDRVVVFDDTDGDGAFDQRQVVWDKGANLSGIELGFGGVWLCSLPNLLFVPCDFNADKPAMGKPDAVLDGWSLQCKHNVFNSLIWGPDGWLYGCNGITATSQIGKPGTPAKDRVPMNCGVWRYHPTRKVFEVFASGTTNPFGLDFDDYGEAFITNCVIHHVWHVVPGAHYERMYGEDLNKHVYALMPSIADHLHWGGGHWTTSRGGKGAHDAPGGGHAHSGCAVYLGDNFPDEYRNSVFMCNIHGGRVNRDTLERKGSTYVAKHAPDFLFANDPWHRGLCIKVGPDGGMYVSDWIDTGECHNYDKADTTNGRVYKVTYGKPKAWCGDVSKLSDVELMKLQWHKNDWFVRHARRVLQERPRHQGMLAPEAAKELSKLADDPNPTRRLRALWVAHVTEETLTGFLIKLGLTDRRGDEVVRAWKARIFFDDMGSLAEVPEEVKKHVPVFVRDAMNDLTPAIRLSIASGLQRLPVDLRWEIAQRLLQDPESVRDSYLPLMYWFAVEPLAAADPRKAVALLATSKVSLVRQFLARRLVTLPSGKDGDHLGAIVELLGNFADPTLRRDVLCGVLDGLAGRREVSMPRQWAVTYPKLLADGTADVRDRAMRVAVLFGDPNAIASLRKTTLDPRAGHETRYAALQALLSRQSPDLLPVLQQLLDDRQLRGAAIRGLAAFNDKATPEILLKRYADFTPQEKADVVQTLASRPLFAAALLDAVEGKQVPRADVDVFTARQILNLKQPQLADRLGKVWGQIRPASKERASLTAKYKDLLAEDKMKSADAAKGRAVYAKNCASCHRLYDEGGDIGPALTGSQRSNLDYVLENVIDPSAVVANEYRVTVIQTTGGRFLNGIIKAETDKAVTVQVQNEVVVVPKDEIEERRVSNVSMMPEGILDKLTPEEVRDLVAYLRTKEPVPLPK